MILVLHVLAAMAICGLVLLQHGKGADMGAAFGSGSSGSLFGAAGSANFLSRTTAVLATVFFSTSLGADLFRRRSIGVPQGVHGQGVMERMPRRRSRPTCRSRRRSRPAPAPRPAARRRRRTEVQESQPEIGRRSRRTAASSSNVT